MPFDLAPALSVDVAALEILDATLRQTAAAHAVLDRATSAVRRSVVATQAEGMLTAALSLAADPALRSTLYALRYAAVDAAVAAQVEEDHAGWGRGYDAGIRSVRVAS